MESTRTQHSQPETSQLLARLRARDPRAAEMLQDQFGPALLRYCENHLLDHAAAEDALQEVLLKSLTADLPPSLPAESLRPWLFRVARNHCLNLRRARLRRPAAPLPEPAILPTARRTGLLTGLVREEQHARLKHLLSAMSRNARELLHLRYVEGLSREEIAAVLEAPLTLVKSRLHEALHRLRQHATLLDSSVSPPNRAQPAS